MGGRSSPTAPTGPRSAAMPVPTTGGEAPRFPPPKGSGDGRPSFEPGIVEVKFREGLAPSIRTEALHAGAMAAIVSPTAGPLDDVNRILQRHGLVRAEPTFLTTHEEATASQVAAEAKGMAVPNLSHFVTLHFPSASDTKRIADELNELPEVEKAAPVPTALPPSLTMTREPRASSFAVAAVAAPTGSPLMEPLVGSSDQVVLDTGTSLENQWYIFRCRVNEAWTRSTGKDVVIADVDWGYLTSHQDLSSNIQKNYNAFDGTTDVTHGGSMYHGTGVAGLAGAAANGVGMAGVAFEATLWAIQADSGTGSALPGNAWARGIDWVRTTDSGGKRKVCILEVQTGAYGNYEQVISVNAAIQNAIAAGVVVCVAAGNGDRDAGIDDSGNPIPVTGSILVGATDYHPTINKRSWFSNYGPRIDISAPGDSSHDLTCDSSSDTAYRNGFGGTSGATPKVAGVAALMLAANPSLTHAGIRAILNSTGSALDPDPGKPTGTFLNAGAAVAQVATGAVGSLEIFARGSDSAVWHKRQTAPSNGWGEWASLGGWIDILESARNADGRLEIFARGADKALWHNRQTTPNNGWSGWAPLGGWIDLLAVDQNADGRLEIFARGPDKALWHKWQTAPSNGWSGWASLGGWIDLLAVARNADGRLEVFARGSDGAIWHRAQTAPGNGWSGWASLGGWFDLLSVNQNADGRLEIFARGSDGAVWHNWQTAPNNGWSGWASLGGWIDLLAVARNADGRLGIFARGSDGAIWQKEQTAPGSGWGEWASLGGWFDLLTVNQNADGRLEIFARGSDKALWHKWQTAPNNGWSGWDSLGGWIDILTTDQNAP